MSIEYTFLNPDFIAQDTPSPVLVPVSKKIGFIKFDKISELKDVNL